MTMVRTSEEDLLTRIWAEEYAKGTGPDLQGRIDRRYHAERPPRERAVHAKTVLEVGDRFGLWGSPCGIDCGEGWADVLDRLFSDLTQVGWSGECVQVKEKFGQLRVYLPRADMRDRRIEERVADAERSSATICEECGRPGRLRTEGVHRRWWTLCDDHAAQEGYSAHCHMVPA